MSLLATDHLSLGLMPDLASYPNSKVITVGKWAHPVSDHKFLRAANLHSYFSLPRNRNPINVPHCLTITLLNKRSIHSFPVLIKHVRFKSRIPSFLLFCVSYKQHSNYVWWTWSMFLIPKQTKQHQCMNQEKQLSRLQSLQHQWDRRDCLWDKTCMQTVCDGVTDEWQ